jgi:peptide/nickel transport system substrate-binding protein
MMVKTRHCLTFTCLAAALLLWGCGRSEPTGRSRDELRIAIPTPPASLDPHQVADEVCNSFCLHFFDPLVILDANLKVRPWVASAWQNPDPQTWIFTIRPDIRFQDGCLLTAADAAYSLERIRSLPNSPKQPLLLAIRSVQALDSRRLKIVTRTPYMPLLPKLAQVMIVPEHYYRPAPLEYVRFHPMGSGPYRLVQPLSPGEFVLTSVGSHWSGIHPAPTLRFFIVPEDRRRSRMLLDGEVDFIKEPDPATFPELEHSGRLRLIIRPGIRLIYLGLSFRDRLRDGTPNPFRDRAVRQAVSCALNRADLVGGPLQSLAEPADDIVPPQVFGHVPDQTVPLHDSGRARELLRQSDFPREREFLLYYPENKYFRIRETVTLCARQLAEAGIRVRPVAVAPEEFARQNFMAGGYDLFVTGWIPVSGDASDYFDHCFYTRGKAPGYGSFNYVGYSNPMLDDMIEESATIAQRDKRLAVLQQILSRATDDLIWIPLVYLKDTAAYRKDLVWQPRIDRYLLAYQITTVK